MRFEYSLVKMEKFQIYGQVAEFAEKVLAYPSPNSSYVNILHNYGRFVKIKRLALHINC